MSPGASGPTQDEARLRADAEVILAAALRAVDPEPITAHALREDPPVGEGPLLLISVGKAAGAMARGAVRAVGRHRIRAGVVVEPERRPTRAAGSLPDAELPPQLERIVAGHPLPTSASVDAAERVLGLLRDRAGDGRSPAAGGTGGILFLISGGGSALLTLPQEGLELADLRATTELLLQAGAPIHELNTVRKHLERTKGGQLARAVGGVPVRGVVISDVVGDSLEVIASGPLSPDSSTFRDALDVLDRRGLTARVPEAVRGVLAAGASGRIAETPKPGDPCFDGIRLTVAAGIGTALDAGERAAIRLGYATHVASRELTGEAREVGRRLAALGRRIHRGEGPVEPPACVLAGGETTVTVKGDGRGGRNQEVALGAAVELAGCRGILVASLATDGIDGPTDAAGARVTGSTVGRAAAAGLHAEAALRNNDAYPCFRALDDLIVTGPTGTNVMDVQLILVAPGVGEGPGGDPPAG